MIVFDKDTKSLRTYNVKRGNGSYDAGKRRLIFEDLIRTNMLLADYGAKLGFPVQNHEAKIIFYYGIRSIPSPISLVGDELDAHFGYPVFRHVEAANEYFRKKLYDLVENW
jgi:hypothetical protein